MCTHSLAIAHLHSPDATLCIFISLIIVLLISLVIVLIIVLVMVFSC